MRSVVLSDGSTLLRSGALAITVNVVCEPRNHLLMALGDQFVAKIAKLFTAFNFTETSRISNPSSHRVEYFVCDNRGVVVVGGGGGWYMSSPIF